MVITVSSLYHAEVVTEQYKNYRVYMKGISGLFSG